jgi:hypothetical protein
MKLIKAGAALATLLTAGFSVAACTPSSSTPSSSGSSPALSGPPPSSQTGMSLVYSGTQLYYFMQISYPSAGGSVSGTVTVAAACDEPDSSTGMVQYGPFQISGSYDPNNSFSGNEFQFTPSTANIAGSQQEVIGGLTGSIGAITDGYGGLVLDSTEDWNSGSHSDFVSAVESADADLPPCGS